MCVCVGSMVRKVLEVVDLWEVADVLEFSMFLNQLLFLFLSLVLFDMIGAV